MFELLKTGVNLSENNVKAVGNYIQTTEKGVKCSRLPNGNYHNKVLKKVESGTNRSLGQTM